eukprot:6283943-Amphidinium_carterae.1
MMGRFCARYLYEKEPTKRAIRFILDQLHYRKLELAYVTIYEHWRVARQLFDYDLLRIAELDHSWQSLWTTYRRAEECVKRIGDVPSHVISILRQDAVKMSDTFGKPGAAEVVHDALAWCKTMHPDSEDVPS